MYDIRCRAVIHLLEAKQEGRQSLTTAQPLARPVKGAARRVALLRGINVGGARTLPMADLRHLARRLGMRDVSTLGASGNLLYTSTKSAQSDAAGLERALKRTMGRASVIVRSAVDMAAVVKMAPFVRPDPAVPDKWRFVAFLGAPSGNSLPDVPAKAAIAFAGRSLGEVFYTMREPSLAAIAMAGRLERALGTSITVRNWNVVRSIAARLLQ